MAPVARAACSARRAAGERWSVSVVASVKIVPCSDSSMPERRLVLPGAPALAPVPSPRGGAQAMVVASAASVPAAAAAAVTAAAGRESERFTAAILTALRARRNAGERRPITVHDHAHG